MKINFLTFLFLILFSNANCQDFTGQWNGRFVDKSTSFSNFGGEQCDYTIDLECTGTGVSGYSYTYFSEGGKKYYTICKLTGFVDKKQHYIEIKEVERTKTNVPVTIRNCFQVHKLTYFKQGDTATLDGKWVPAPGQQGDCGFGTTLLTRRELKQRYPAFNSLANKPAVIKKNSVKSTKTTVVKPVAKKVVPGTKTTVAKANKPPVKSSTGILKKLPAPVDKNNLVKKAAPAQPDTVAIETRVPEIVVSPVLKFEKRSNTVLKTIQVQNKTVMVDLYDNGEVDGDSISLFYNDKLLLSSKKLSEKPISLTINVEDDMVNELVMYAENLGTIPPNTALMVVTDGAKRYEVRITSDLQKSGVINFVHRQE